MTQVISRAVKFLFFYPLIRNQMKTLQRISIATFALLTFWSCGPVVVATRPGPPPPWFYPSRLELVRYVYFPEFRIYYDLTERMYLYLDGGVWIRVKDLPPRFRTLNLERSRYVRVRDYHDENIARYHRDTYGDRGRSNLNTPPGRRNN